MLAMIVPQVIFFKGFPFPNHYISPSIVNAIQLKMGFFLNYP